MLLNLMIIFLLLCAFLQTLQCKPLPPALAPGSLVAANVSGVTAPDCSSPPDDRGQHLRTIYTIVQSCLFTIFACVWTAIHPNINGPRDSRWTRTKRRAITTFYAVIAPEMMLLWALQQRVAAKEIADDYNKKFPKPASTPKSILQRIQSWFQPLPYESTRQGDNQLWTPTHGFFVQMGGFILYKNGFPKEVLHYDRLAELLEMKFIDAPTATERDLKDKSKGNTISKAIVILQTSWFVLQCIIRVSSHLPLCELEVLTLAFSVMNGAIYAAWWGKPQGVQVAIRVPLNGVGLSMDNDDRRASTRSRQSNSHRHDDNQPLIPRPGEPPHDESDEKDHWLLRMIREDRDNHSAPVFLVAYLPYRLVLWLIRPMAKALTHVRSKEHLRVSMFAFGSVPTYVPERVASSVGIVFGAIHLLGWPLDFPLPRDRILWQISSIILTVTPFVFLVGYARRDGAHGIKISGITTQLVGVLAPFYIAARFILIMIACKAILHPSPNVLADVPWTRYIPHF